MTLTSGVKRRPISRLRGGSMADVESDPAVAVCFAVEIDGYDLGTFSSCDGLGCEVVIEQREEGGNQWYVHQLPGRMKYPNVKLTRPINGDSAKLAKWFAGMAGPVARTGGAIRAMTLEGKEVASWALQDVIPVRWTGPQLGVDNVKVATETLEIAHHGFVAK
jgi:phage tail-like protein